MPHYGPGIETCLLEKCVPGIYFLWVKGAGAYGSQPYHLFVQSRTGLKNMWHVCPRRYAEKFPWQAAITVVVFYLFCPTSISVLWRICVHTHISDGVGIAYALPSQVKHFYTYRERCEVLTGYLSLGYRPGGDWANTWHTAKAFTIYFFKQEVAAAPVTSTFYSLSHSSRRPLLEI